MRLLLQLTGDHPEMAKEEVRGVMDIASAPYTELFGSEDMLFGLELEEFSTDLQELFKKRFALTRWAGELLCGPSESQDALLEELRGRADEVLKTWGSSFKVVSRRLQSANKAVSGEKLAGEVGFIVKEQTGMQVDLEKPEVIIDLIISDKLYLSHRLLDVPRDELEQRQVKFRQHFSPISLHPKYARACINIARAKTNILDPFCGTGGILLEAGTMGLRPFGSDIDPDMVEGSWRNMDQFEVPKAALQVLDVSDVGRWHQHPDFPVEGFDAIVTDPPYGRSSTTMGEGPEAVFKKAFENIGDVVKKDGLILMVVPEKSYLEFASKLKLIKSFSQNVHGSLTRYYCLFSQGKKA